MFTLGHVPMYNETLNLGCEQVPYFRTLEFSEILLKTEHLLLKTVDAPDQSKGLFLTASGTGAMEATVLNCLNTEDFVLIVNGGTFGERSEKLCILYKIPHKVLFLPYGEFLTKDKLEPYQSFAFSAMLVNIHESSTC